MRPGAVAATILLALVGFAGCLDDEAAPSIHAGAGVVGGPGGTEIQAGTGRIHGQVMDPDQNPLREATVEVRYHPQWKATTSQEGKFVVVNLPPFNYTLIVSHPYSKTRLVSALVEPDRIAQVRVVLNPWGGEEPVAPTEGP